MTLLLSALWPTPALAGLNTWTTTLSLPTIVGSGPGHGLAMDPATPSIVYAASFFAYPTPGANLFRSDDGGRHWAAVPGAGFVRGPLAVVPGSPQIVYGVGATGSVVKSLDGGRSFTETGLPLTVGVDRIGFIAVDQSLPTTIYAATDLATTGSEGRIFKSAADGKNWTELPVTGCMGLTSLVVAPLGSAVYATATGRFCGFWIRSLDGGISWQLVTGGTLPDWPYTTVLAYAFFNSVDPFDPNTVYASSCERLFKTSSGGDPWLEIDTGLPTHDGPCQPLEVAIDPTTPSTLYAATKDGVYRSLTGGLSWAKFGDGLPPGLASNLIIDSSGRNLHVEAGGAVYDYTIAEPCTPSATSLCLLGNRFMATASAVDPRMGRREVGTAVPSGDRYGYFSLPGFTGDPAFPEVLVKMVDATSVPGQGFWVFHSGLTDLQYTLSIVDTVTGQQKSYRNDRSDPQSLCGGADTTTFAASGGSESAASSSPTAQARRVASPLTLLGRFQAVLSARDPRTGTEAEGLAVTQDSKWGFFSLPALTGDPAFPEVFVKMVDATSLPGGQFWIFHTGLTDLEYTLTVTDNVTGASRIYHNDRSDPSRLCGGADTQAFHD